MLSRPSARISVTATLILVLTSAVLVDGRLLDGKLQRTAAHGRARVDAILNTLACAVPMRPPGRRLQVQSDSVCLNATTPCCDVQSRLLALNGTDGCPAFDIRSLQILSPPGTPPAYSDRQLDSLCSSSCANAVHTVLHDLRNITDPDGCTEVVNAKIGTDMLCLTDDQDGFCWHTARALVLLREFELSSGSATIASRQAIMNLLCSPCGVRIVHYFAELPLLEKEVIDISSFFPIDVKTLPFICARDPNTGELCFGDSSAGLNASDACSYCGRAAFRVGALDLGFDDMSSPLLNCGCAEYDASGKTCLAVFEDHDVALNGTGRTHQGGNGSHVVVPPVNNNTCDVNLVVCACSCGGNATVECSGMVDEFGAFPLHSCLATAQCGATSCSNNTLNFTATTGDGQCLSNLAGCSCDCRLNTSCEFTSIIDNGGGEGLDGCDGTTLLTPLQTCNTTTTNTTNVIQCNSTTVCAADVLCTDPWCDASVCGSSASANMSCVTTFAHCNHNVTVAAGNGTIVVVKGGGGGPTVSPSPVPSTAPPVCVSYTACSCDCADSVKAECAFYGDLNGTMPVDACNITAPCGHETNCQPAAFGGNSTNMCASSLLGCTCECSILSNCTVATNGTLNGGGEEDSSSDEGDGGSGSAFQPRAVQYCNATEVVCVAEALCDSDFCLSGGGGGGNFTNSTSPLCVVSGNSTSLVRAPGTCLILVSNSSCSAETPLPQPPSVQLEIVNATGVCTCSCPRNVSVVCSGTTVGNDTMTQCAVTGSCDNERLCDAMGNGTNGFGNTTLCTTLSDCSCDCHILDACFVDRNNANASVMCLAATVTNTTLPPIDFNGTNVTNPSPSPMPCFGLQATCDVVSECGDVDITFCGGGLNSTNISTCLPTAYCMFSSFEQCVDFDVGVDSDSESESEPGSSASISPLPSPSPSTAPPARVLADVARRRMQASISASPLPSPAACANYTVCACNCPRSVVGACAYYGDLGGAMPPEACVFESPCENTMNCHNSNDSTFLCSSDLGGCSCECVVLTNCADIATGPGTAYGSDDYFNGFIPVAYRGCNATEVTCAAQAPCSSGFCDSGVCVGNGTAVGACTVTNTVCSAETAIVTPPPTAAVVNATGTCSCTCPRGVSVVCNGTTVGSETMGNCLVAATCDNTRTCDAADSALCTSLADCSCDCDIVETCFVDSSNTVVCDPAKPIGGNGTSPCMGMMATCDVSSNCGTNDFTFCNASQVDCTPSATCRFTELDTCAVFVVGGGGGASASPSPSMSPSAASPTVSASPIIGSTTFSPSPSASPMPSGALAEPDLTPCLGLMIGVDTACSATCAANVQVLVSETGCCSQCIILGFNATVANFTLPPADVVMSRLASCSINASDLMTCAGAEVLSERLTIWNLRYSFVTANATVEAAVLDSVRNALADAAGVYADAIQIGNVTDLTTGVAFDFNVIASSSAQADVLFSFIRTVADGNLLNLTSLDQLAYSDLNGALYDISQPLLTTVQETATTTTTSGSMSRLLFVAGAVLGAFLML